MDTVSIPHPALPPVALRSDGRPASRAGFGCYRIAVGNTDHERALQHALETGINLIDTSTNYADGASEELVGNVLHRMSLGDAPGRPTIVTKVGYVQGTNLALAREREDMGTPFPEMVKYGSGLWHCIHPDFLDDQITRSLERLQVSSIDVLLLHNPEYFLGWANKKGCRSGEAYAEFYRRIEQAFLHLEREVERGRIRSYGISSNTFPRPSSDPEFCSLETVWQIAQSVGGTGRFSTVQMPMNLLERGAAVERNQCDNTATVLEFARDKGLAVLINRPLNAIADGRLVRLADISCAAVPDDEEVEATIDELIQLENTFYVRFLPHFPFNEEDRAAVIEYLAPGTILKRHWKTFCSYEHWTDVRSQYFLPRMNAGLRAVTPSTSQAFNALADWIHEFKATASGLFRTISCHYAGHARERSCAAKRAVASILGEAFDGSSLSQLAVNVLRATGGVTSVLVGMRQHGYVDDVLAALQKPVDTVLGREEWLKLAVLDDVFLPQVG